MQRTQGGARDGSSGRCWFSAGWQDGDGSEICRQRSGEQLSSHSAGEAFWLGRDRSLQTRHFKCHFCRAGAGPRDRSQERDSWQGSSSPVHLRHCFLIESTAGCEYNSWNSMIRTLLISLHSSPSSRTPVMQLYQRDHTQSQNKSSKCNIVLGNHCYFRHCKMYVAYWRKSKC